MGLAPLTRVIHVYSLDTGFLWNSEMRSGKALESRAGLRLHVKEFDPFQAVAS